MTEEEIQAFLDEHEQLFKDIAQMIICPGCGRPVKPPFFNLGVMYNWAEGCQYCYETA